MTNTAVASTWKLPKPLTVTGVAQCEIITASELLQPSSEQFLGKSIEEIMDTVLQTLGDHLGAILGKVTAVFHLFSVYFNIQEMLRCLPKAVQLFSPLEGLTDASSIRFLQSSGRSIGCPRQ